MQHRLQSVLVSLQSAVVSTQLLDYCESVKRNPTFYRRNLPHWHPPGVAIFVTWRLKDSLPASAVKRLRETHRLLKREAERRNLPIEELSVHINKKLFA